MAANGFAKPGLTPGAWSGNIHVLVQPRAPDISRIRFSLTASGRHLRRGVDILAKRHSPVSKQARSAPPGTMVKNTRNLGRCEEVNTQSEKQQNLQEEPQLQAA